MRPDFKQLALSALGLGSATACLWYWVSGTLLGFRLREKLPPWAKKAWKIFTILSILSMFGVAAGIAVMAKNLAAEAAANATKLVKPSNELVTKLVALPLATPSFKVLTRLKAEEAERDHEQKKAEEAQVKRAVAIAATRAAQLYLQDHYWKAEPRTRKGPFCHVTCLVHHNASYDRETLPEYCAAQWIPPDLSDMPGWFSFAGEKYERTVAWPGPATQGFQSYKLYWKKARN